MASEEARDVRLELDAWRASGADRLDPVRFRFIDALARRASGHSGEARRILDKRLYGLVEAYRDALQTAAPIAGQAEGAVQPREPVAGTLAGLVGYIGNRTQAPAAGRASGMPRLRSIALPEPELIDYFRDTWTRVSADRELRQSHERVPENAGPLNSNHLVHRSLSLMREMSPAYLQQFLSYVDALSWLEQLGAGTAVASKEVPRPAGSRKGARIKRV